MTEGSNFWIVAVNLVIWTGLFAYVLFLDRKVRKLEATPHEDPATTHSREVES